MGKRPYEYDNSTVVSALATYATWKQAAREYSFLNDILTGVAHLDHGGNTRPLKMGMLYDLLSRLPLISTATVREATGFSPSYAAKVRLALAIASSQFEAQLAIRDAMGARPLLPTRQPETTETSPGKLGLGDADRLHPEGAEKPLPTPQVILLRALERCRLEYGTTLYTALRAFGGDIGAVMEKVVGSGDNPSLVDAGVLMVDHDKKATARKPYREPPRPKTYMGAKRLSEARAGRRSRRTQ